jgi:methylated-DNA-[protein]-cysteine S-methyltransferase
MGRIREFIISQFDITDFEKQVLVEVSKIPAGRLSTYGEIASKLGKKGASRAVGNALNKNPLPVIIPCHRVIGAGNLGGYKYGLAAKRTLIQLDRLFSY